MKRSTEFFSEARPYNPDDDACLLDALEQGVAVCQECELFGCGFEIYAHKDGVQIVRPGEEGIFEAPTLREALRLAFGTE